MTTADIIITGAGHAGIESAHIAAKMGARVLLITGNPDFIGQMSCNPAIGGVAKGNIVREIDALGGLMASLIDRAGIHFRMLNASKGSAVWGPRAQADKLLYRTLARQTMENHPNIAVLQARVVRLNVSGDRVSSVTLDTGETINTKSLVIASGTFLNGVIHMGPHSHAGGRAGEPPAVGLTESLRELGIASGRLRTCTPPRLDRRTIDYSKLSEQPGDDDPKPFSFFAKERPRNKIVCWAARTNSSTHQHILEAISDAARSPEKPQTAGPRYCPSIEEKVVRFGDRDGHTLYLEPEGLDSSEVYVNGLFTELSGAAQEKMVQSVAGLENARIVRPGYGIEYDYFQPLQLRPTLESRVVRGLFFAGQVNGSSGYEEAACQGLIAGINAVRGMRGEEPVVLGRETSYIGVLIDDLVTKGTEEPYRMFTARAEYRMILRQDSCDERLTPIGHGLGTITDEQYDERCRFWERKREFAERLGEIKVTPEEYSRILDGTDVGVVDAAEASSRGKCISQTESARDLLRRPEVRIGWLLRGLGVVGKGINPADVSGGDGVNTKIENAADGDLLLGVESDIRYEGFVRKQMREIERLRRYDETRIPDGFSFDDVPGLLTESRQKLVKIRPATLGQAARIGGVTPADISVLTMYLLKSGRR